MFHKEIKILEKQNEELEKLKVITRKNYKEKLDT